MYLVSEYKYFNSIKQKITILGFWHVQRENLKKLSTSTKRSIHGWAVTEGGGGAVGLGLQGETCSLDFKFKAFVVFFLDFRVPF